MFPKHGIATRWRRRTDRNLETGVESAERGSRRLELPRLGCAPGAALSKKPFAAERPFNGCRALAYPTAIRP